MPSSRSFFPRSSSSIMGETGSGGHHTSYGPGLTYDIARFGEDELSASVLHQQGCVLPGDVYVLPLPGPGLCGDDGGDVAQ